jgi:diadenosine tetraphosphate (Ap4A) HIT family hydrolase
MDQPDCPFCRKLAHADELPAGEVIRRFDHSTAFLGQWQYFQGYCVVAFKRHAQELSELSAEERHGFFDEMCLVARTIEDCFHPHKLNYELLGNQVPHLHWHIFPRYQSDPDRLKPVWLALDRAERHLTERQRYESGPLDHQTISATLRQQLAQSIASSGATESLAKPRTRGP